MTISKPKKRPDSLQWLMQDKSLLHSRMDWLDYQFSSVTQLCSTLCDPMNHSTPGFLVQYQLPESTQAHVHWVGDAIQPSHTLSSPALNLAQHQALFQWVSSSHQVDKVLELQLQLLQLYNLSASLTHFSAQCCLFQTILPWSLSEFFKM